MELDKLFSINQSALDLAEAEGHQKNVELLFHANQN